jgi:hypothetical protein
MSLSFRKAIENERRRKQLERRTKRVDRRLVAGLSLRIKIPPDLNSTAFGQQRLQNAAFCAATIASASDNLYLYQPIRVTLPREQKLARCRELLDMPAPEPPALEGAKDYPERYEELIALSCGNAQSVTKVACW